MVLAECWAASAVLQARLIQQNIRINNNNNNDSNNSASSGEPTRGSAAVSTSTPGRVAAWCCAGSWAAPASAVGAREAWSGAGTAPGRPASACSPACGTQSSGFHKAVAACVVLCLSLLVLCCFLGAVPARPPPRSP